jgi:predicted Holliday junction resolvase-like endonuclease
LTVKTKKIIDADDGLGHEHDFNLYKRTIGTGIDEDILMYADLGYLGIHDYHANSIIPIKASKNNPLNEKEKAYNKRLARKRVAVEHINAKIQNNDVSLQESLQKAFA